MWFDMSAHEQTFEDFFTFLLRRFEWTKSGSCLGGKGKIDLSKLPGGDKDTSIRTDKKNASGAMYAHEISSYLDRLPILLTSAVRKMENGKGRVLLPTDIISYYIGTYVLHELENRLDRRVDVGEPKNPVEKLNFLINLCQQSKQKYVGWSFDWDNFNG